MDNNSIDSVSISFEPDYIYKGATIVRYDASGKKDAEIYVSDDGSIGYVSVY